MGAMLFVQIGFALKVTSGGEKSPFFLPIQGSRTGRRSAQRSQSAHFFFDPGFYAPLGLFPPDG